MAEQWRELKQMLGARSQLVQVATENLSRLEPVLVRDAVVLAPGAVELRGHEHAFFIVEFDSAHSVPILPHHDFGQLPERNLG